jgi:hypothetical protein
MEAIHDSGRARVLGVSNVNVDQLKDLWKDARVRPRFVQNRCYAIRGWDRHVRQFCKANGLVYQGFFEVTTRSLVCGGWVAAGLGAGFFFRMRPTVVCPRCSPARARIWAIFTFLG